jgi:hypothetical protein
MKPILRLQEGGDVMPFVDYMPFQGLESARTAGASDSGASASSKGDNDVGLKTLLGLVKELDGLPVDTDLVVKSIKDMYSDATLFNNGHLSTDDVVTTYLSALQKIKVAKFNEAQFNTAQKEVTEKGGLHEVAIDEHGRLFVQDTESGAMGKMSVEEFRQLEKSEPDKYEALTNSNLLYYRAHDPNFAFKNDILRTVSNGIGEKQVTELLLQAANGIGKETLKQEGYSEKSGEAITRGMGELQEYYAQGMTVNGLYKQEYVSEDQASRINMTLSYLWSTLPENAKVFLKYKSGGSDQEAKELMSDLLFSRNSSKHEYNQNLVKNPAEGDDGDGKGGKAELDPVKAMILGMGYSKDITINPGTSYEAHLTGNYSVLTNENGNPLSEYTSLREVSSGAFAPSLDFNNATFGGARIETLNRAYLNNADIVAVDLPIDIEYYNDTHILRPDIKLLNKIEQLHTDIKQGRLNKNDAAAVNAECQQLGLPPMYASLDENGIPQLNTEYFARFARIDGVVDERALASGEEVDNTVSAAGDNKRQNFKSFIEKVDKSYSLSDGFLGMGADQLYEGAIYIPIRQDIIAASLGGKNYYNLPGTKDAIQIASKWADEAAVRNYRPAPSLASQLGK